MSSVIWDIFQRSAMLRSRSTCNQLNSTQRNCSFFSNSELKGQWTWSAGRFHKAKYILWIENSTDYLTPLFRLPGYPSCYLHWKRESGENLKEKSLKYFEGKCFHCIRPWVHICGHHILGCVNYNTKFYSTRTWCPHAKPHHLVVSDKYNITTVNML